MINTSNEYKEAIRLSGKKQYAKASITLADGTVLQLDNSNIMESGLTIKDGTSGSGSFQIGSAIINELTLNIANFSGEFNEYDFTDAIIRPSIGLQLSKTIETLNKGVFTVDDAKAIGGTIQIIALDNMNKFDTSFLEVTQSFPCTTSQLLRTVALHCGVPLATTTFLNDDFVIERRPSDEAVTCREIVAWIAQLSGNFARCNIDGTLELKWYDIGAFEQSDSLDGGYFDDNNFYFSGDSADGGDFTNYNSGDSVDGGTFLDMERYHHIYALSQATLGTDDVVITGIQVKAMGTETDYGETVLFGSTGYVIEITDNPLITENKASTIANSIGAKIVGMRFRPMNISALSDPSIEAGDVAYVSDRKGNSYQTLISNLSYTISNYESLSCDAETQSKKNSVRFSAATKAIVEARKVAKQEISTYDLAVKQLNDLLAHSFGVYKSEEKQEDGASIYYMHDKPTRAESQTIWKQTADAFAVSTDGGKTYKAGFDSNGNAVLNVLNAIGINADWINVGTLKGVRGEFDNGRIGKFNITNSGLENDSFKLYDADNKPWLWMHDNEGDKHSTMQTVGFLHSDGDLMAEDNTSCFFNFEGMKISVAEDNVYVRETSYKKDEISTDGDYSITAIDGNLSITSSYGSIFFMDGYANFSATGGQIQIYEDSLFIQGTEDMYINGRSVNDLFSDISSIKSDITAIKAKLGML